MQKSFKTILIPVDFTLNTEVAICKALEICNSEEVSIHLQHIQNPSMSDVSFGRSSITEKEIEANIKLKEWKQSIEEHFPMAEISYEVKGNASIEKGIIAKALEIEPDLIVIGKKSNHSWFPFLNTIIPASVSAKTKCAVLTVKPGSLHNKIKNIVVPVIDHIPGPKMDAVASICKNNRVRVFLVTFANEENVPEQFLASSLLKLYQWLKTALHCQVDYAVLHGRNKARSILRFAEKNKADILLLNSESETRIGWPGKHISDVIPPESKVQVLLVG